MRVKRWQVQIDPGAITGYGVPGAVVYASGYGAALAIARALHPGRYVDVEPEPFPSLSLSQVQEMADYTAKRVRGPARPS